MRDPGTDQPGGGQPPTGDQRARDAFLRRPISRRGVLRLGIMVPTAAALAACSKKVGGTSSSPKPSSTNTALESELNIYNWAAYLNPDNLKAFKSEYSVDATQDFYASNEELIAKLKGGATGYDIIAPTGYAVEILAKSGLLLELDHSRIPNLSNADPQFLGAGFDPDNRFSVPKDWGTTGVGFLTDHVSEDITSWAQFYDLAAKYTGKYTVLDSSPEVVGSALKLLGYSYNTLDQGEVDAGHRQADLDQGRHRRHHLEPVPPDDAARGDLRGARLERRLLLREEAAQVRDPERGQRVLARQLVHPGLGAAPEPGARVPELDPHARASGDGDRATPTTRAACRTRSRSSIRRSPATRRSIRPTT